jgi:hypothetical protein
MRFSSKFYLKNDKYILFLLNLGPCRYEFLNTKMLFTK